MVFSPPTSAPNAAYILLAEFNIDSGSGLKHQFPQPTGASELVLADLMLPDGAHDRTEDWTVFLLNQTVGLAVAPVEEHMTGQEEPGGRDLLYVISLVRTRKDNSVRRGAVCKAMAICSRHPFIQIFKPILLLGLEDYFADPSIDCLERLYDAINAMPMGGIPNLSYHERLVLRASDRKDVFEEKFVFPKSNDNHYADGATRSDTPDGPTGDEAHHFEEDYDLSSFRERSKASSAEPVSREIDAASGAAARRPKDTHWFDTQILYRDKRIPVRIPLQTFPSEIGEYSLIKLIQTFSSSTALSPSGPLHPHLHTNGTATHPVILLFNALVTEKRVVFLGHGQAAGTVAEYVLAACALGSGCGAILEGFIERAFPYSNLTIFEDFQAVPGYIAGVTNPIFELHADSWDVFCNVETGKITVSKDIATDSPLSPLAAALERTPTEASGLVPDSDAASKPSVGSASSAAAVPTRTDAGKESTDSLFMEEITQAIQAHFGEAVVRSRFMDYVQRFVRLASRHEEALHGNSTIGPPCRPFSGDRLGSGIVFSDESSVKREMAANAARIEGWLGTDSHRLYKQRHATGQHSSFQFDLQHQLARLRSTRKLSDGEVSLLFDTLARDVRGDAEIIEILSQMPPHLGGLLPLAFGLLHPLDHVRAHALDLFRRLEGHPTGRKFCQQLNAFYRLAYLRQNSEQEL